MNASPLSKRSFQRAMTLIEITIVIAVLLGLITVLFLGVSAYKKGSDRALCIQNIAAVQKAVRSYGNLFDVDPGESVTLFKDQIIGTDKFFTQDPICRGGGTYTYGGDIMPLNSVAYLSCSISNHVPSSVTGW